MPGNLNFISFTKRVVFKRGAFKGGLPVCDNSNVMGIGGEKI
jgi:hypothetical protein